MKYQLVIQFPENLIGGFDLLVKLEDILEENFHSGEVDGHDCGSGQMNIFIYTDKPLVSFQEIHSLFEAEPGILQNMKVAYRDLEEEDFICVWPKGLKVFRVT